MIEIELTTFQKGRIVTYKWRPEIAPEVEGVITNLAMYHNTAPIVRIPFANHSVGLHTMCTGRNTVESMESGAWSLSMESE